MSMNRHPLEPFVFDSINRRKGTISIPELAIDLAGGVGNTQKEIIMGSYSAEIAEDQTNAVCQHCGHPFESGKVIEGRSCPGCHNPITGEELERGWCIDCGAALRSDEAGMELCWNCVVGVD